MKKILLFIYIIFISGGINAQFAPPAGQAGSSAINADSSVFIEWATSCEISKGLINIADSSMGYATYGDSESALGIADNNVVSLGDGGMATLHFEHPVTNGNGWDFAIFENSFDDSFLELAFVEVSSDNENFFRFPAISLTQTEDQIESFGNIDATKIHNLAGKYRVMYGTPFDLEELKNEPGLNVNNIVAIRIIDVVGNISDTFARYDSEGNKINDPWPTPFESGGFDLDAVGIIHNTSNTDIQNKKTARIKAFPNPCKDVINISGEIELVIIRDITGKVLLKSNENRVNVSDLKPGLLITEVVKKNGEHYLCKILKSN